VASHGAAPWRMARRQLTMPRLVTPELWRPHASLCNTRTHWRIDSFAPEHFDINPGLGSTIGEAWLADVVRLAHR
jgi:hypothetical protein